MGRDPDPYIEKQVREAGIWPPKKGANAKRSTGRKKATDVIGGRVMVGKIGTGEIEDQTLSVPKSSAAELASKDGKARAKAPSKNERKEIAQKVVKKQWG